MITITFDRNEYAKKYYQAHKEEISNKGKLFYEENKEEYLSTQRIKKAKWKKEHSEEHKLRGRNEIIRTRKRFLEMYGDSCKICGEKEFQFLTLDHVNNDMIRGNNYLCEYYKAIREYRPDMFQVLCYNCNCRKMIEQYKLKQYSTNEKIIKQRKYQSDIKDKFFEMYGNKCNCPGCKETSRSNLTLDHILNDGYIRKSTQREGGKREYREAVKKYNPDVYQILCFNCNCGKERNNGICPHIK